jgi:hypothetical protein
MKLRHREAHQDSEALAPCNNTPQTIDVLGSLFLSILSGHRRNTRMTSLRSDRVNSNLLGVSAVASNDSARRACLKIEEQPVIAWLRAHLESCYAPLQKTPLILDVEAQTGDQSHSNYSIPGLMGLLNHLALNTHPLLLNSIGRLTENGRQKKMIITSTHSDITKLQPAYTRLVGFFDELQAIAPQLASADCWNRILAKAMEKYRANIGEGTQIGPPLPT